MISTKPDLVFISKVSPLAARASDGTFVLTLSVRDDIGPRAREPWCIHWAGEQALAFWTTHRADLQPGRALYGSFTKLRAHTNANSPFIDAQVISLALAPSARAGHSNQPQETTTP